MQGLTYSMPRRTSEQALSTWESSSEETCLPWRPKEHTHQSSRETMPPRMMSAWRNSPYHHPTKLVWTQGFIRQQPCRNSIATSWWEASSIKSRRLDTLMLYQIQSITRTSSAKKTQWVRHLLESLNKQWKVCQSTSFTLWCRRIGIGTR